MLDCAWKPTRQPAFSSSTAVVSTISGGSIEDIRWSKASSLTPETCPPVGARKRPRRPDGLTRKGDVGASGRARNGGGRLPRGTGPPVSDGRRPRRAGSGARGDGRVRAAEPGPLVVDRPGPQVGRGREQRGRDGEPAAAPRARGQGARQVPAGRRPGQR